MGRSFLLLLALFSLESTGNDFHLRQSILGMWIESHRYPNGKLQLVRQWS